MAEPVNVCAPTVLLDPLSVGTPAGQEIVGWVKLPAAIVGTPAGHATVPWLETVWVSVALGPLVVPVATPPVGLAVE
jgi:hypothetical protein